MTANDTVADERNSQFQAFGAAFGGNQSFLVLLVSFLVRGEFTLRDSVSPDFSSTRGARDAHERVQFVEQAFPRAFHIGLNLPRAVRRGGTAASMAVAVPLVAAPGRIAWVLVHDAVSANEPGTKSRSAVPSAGRGAIVTDRRAGSFPAVDGTTLARPNVATGIQRVFERVT
jgi:hypothetical protein